MWSLIEQFQSILHPPCLLCGSWHANMDNYCSACYQDLPHNTHCCIRCALPLSDSNSIDQYCGQCLRQPPEFNRSLAALYYLPPVSSLIHTFKDQDNQVAGRLLSACLSHYIVRRKLSLPELIIPMPLHHRRLQQRGFNQAAVIVQHLSKTLALTTTNKLVQRCANTPSQQGLNQPQRQANLRQAFRVQAPKSVMKLFGKIRHIAIVDDVMTTGASANALAKTIKQANPNNLYVEVWCLARTLPPHSKLHLY